MRISIADVDRPDLSTGTPLHRKAWVALIHPTLQLIYARRQHYGTPKTNDSHMIKSLRELAMFYLNVDQASSICATYMKALNASGIQCNLSLSFSTITPTPPLHTNVMSLAPPIQYYASFIIRFSSICSGPQNLSFQMLSKSNELASFKLGLDHFGCQRFIELRLILEQLLVQQIGHTLREYANSSTMATYALDHRQWDPCPSAMRYASEEATNAASSDTTLYKRADASRSTGPEAV